MTDPKLTDAKLADASLVDTVAEAATLLRGTKIAILTGAGISTDSGIPDYRSPESPKRTPMTIDNFLESEQSYKRYWMGSYYGWTHMRSVQPNAGHFALAKLESAGLVEGILTQNVDSLHEAAGSHNVVHLHGNMEQARCIDNGHTFPRTTITNWIKEANPTVDFINPELNPDGDANVEVTEHFLAPTCPLCGSRIKPDVIYFGELMLPETVKAAKRIIDEAGSLLIAGSSLMVNSGHRFLNRAVNRDIPVVIVNRGPVKSEQRANIKIEQGLSDVLPELVRQLS